jgi:hypothetical protein
MRALFAGLFLWGLLGSAAGCSVLVDPESEPARCVIENGKSDPCPAGTECISGRCRTGCIPEVCRDGQDNDCDGKTDEQGAPKEELCGNKRDDDCDGKVDEEPDDNLPETCGDSQDNDCDGKVDEGHDLDMDGLSWCGNTIVQNGGEDADCDDFDPTVRPGLPEICDGRDNDCDNRIDETTTDPLCGDGLECLGQRCEARACTVDGPPGQCGENQRCDESSGRCVADGCKPGSCPAPKFCDQASGECRDTRRANGDPCVANSDCSSGSCVDQAALRIRSEAARLCTQACCSDADCATTERCYVSGSGARSCLPRTLTPAPLGVQPQCLADNQCGVGPICAVVGGQRLVAPSDPLRDDLTSPACARPGFGLLGAGRGCAGDDNCATQACVPGPSFIPASVCTLPCGSSRDCQDLQENADGILSISPRSYCRFVPRGRSPDYLPLCVFARISETGDGAFGAPCANSNACLEAACVGAAGEKPGICSVTCCRDSDCPSLKGEPTTCRPVAFGQHFEMRCMP